MNFVLVSEMLRKKKRNETATSKTSDQSILQANGSHNLKVSKHDDHIRGWGEHALTSTFSPFSILSPSSPPLPPPPPFPHACLLRFKNVFGGRGGGLEVFGMKKRIKPSPGMEFGIC